MTFTVVIAAVLILAVGAQGADGPAVGATAYLAAAQRDDGGFGEAGRASDVALTAWAALGLVAGGGSEEARSAAADFLKARPGQIRTQTDRALWVMAVVALGGTVGADQIALLRDHRPGILVNATIWTVLALRSAGEAVPSELVKEILATQARDGGWAWSRGGRPDSNDTAAAIQALRAAGTAGAPIRRGITALRRFQRVGGGFSLSLGREPDAQSTAWAIQALISAGERPGKAPFRFLARLRRPDGSYRYSVQYGTTPVWVTAQGIPALAGKPFPLR